MRLLRKKITMFLTATLCVSMLIHSTTVMSYAATEPVNEAQGKTITASSVESSPVLAEYAVDGDRDDGSSRWGSAIGSGPEWICVDLGKETDVKCFCTYWESAKADKYKIQIANTETVPKENEWITVAEFNESPEPILHNGISVLDAVVLPEVKKARYVRLYIDHHTAEDPMNRMPTWNTISIYEFEVYGAIPSDILPIYNNDINSALGIDDKINDIGTVTLESEPAITEARTSYDALSSKDKFYVTKYDVLEEAETELNRLKQPADYSAVDKALNDVSTLDENLYVNFSEVDTAVNAVVRGKRIAEQAEVDKMAADINTAIKALVYKNADYSAVNKALADAKALDKDLYVDFTQVDKAVKNVVTGKNITEQAEVDKMAADINAAMKELVKITPSKADETTGKTNVTTKDDKAIAGTNAAKPNEAKPNEAKTETPKTGDHNNIVPWMMTFVVALTVAGFAIAKRKEY